jgi:hypothetical protein
MTEKPLQAHSLRDLLQLQDCAASSRERRLSDRLDSPRAVLSLRVALYARRSRFQRDRIIIF